MILHCHRKRRCWSVKYGKSPCLSLCRIFLSFAWIGWYKAKTWGSPASSFFMAALSCARYPLKRTRPSLRATARLEVSDSTQKPIRILVYRIRHSELHLNRHQLPHHGKGLLGVHISIRLQVLSDLKKTVTREIQTVLRTKRTSRLGSTVKANSMIWFRIAALTTVKQNN